MPVSSASLSLLQAASFLPPSLSPTLSLDKIGGAAQREGVQLAMPILVSQHRWMGLWMKRGPLTFDLALSGQDPSKGWGRDSRQEAPAF